MTDAKRTIDEGRPLDGRVRRHELEREMKKQVNELVGRDLDDAVFRAEGLAETRSTIITMTNFGSGRGGALVRNNVPAYSSDWSHGGPIMQREGISPERHKPDSMDSVDPMVSDGRWIWCTETGYGPTMLVAAMREFVRRKFGDEVEL